MDVAMETLARTRATNMMMLRMAAPGTRLAGALFDSVLPFDVIVRKPSTVEAGREDDFSDEHVFVVLALGGRDPVSHQLGPIIDESTWEFADANAAAFSARVVRQMRDRSSGVSLHSIYQHQRPHRQSASAPVGGHTRRHHHTSLCPGDVVLELDMEANGKDAIQSIMTHVQ